MKQIGRKILLRVVYLLCVDMVHDHDDILTNVCIIMCRLC